MSSITPVRDSYLSWANAIWTSKRSYGRRHDGYVPVTEKLLSACFGFGPALFQKSTALDTASAGSWLFGSGAQNMVRGIIAAHKKTRLASRFDRSCCWHFGSNLIFLDKPYIHPGEWKAYIHPGDPRSYIHQKSMYNYKVFIYDGVDCLKTVLQQFQLYGSVRCCLSHKDLANSSFLQC